MKNKKSHTAKRLFSMLFFVLFPTFAFTQSGIVVKYVDGAEQTYNIDAAGKWSFDTSNLLIQTSVSSSPTSIPLSIIRRITFSPYSSNAGISESTTNASFSVYPNPVSDYFQVNGTDTDKMHVSIYSLTGQKVASGYYNSGESVSVSQLNAGVYLVRINNKSVKIIKL